MSRAVGKSPSKLFAVGIAVFVCLAAFLYAAKIAEADQMVASWYGPGFEGATTASGEPFNASDFTAAHKTLPFGTKLTVTLEGRSVVVRVNDRGPFVAGRDLDLSQAAAEQIGLTAIGEATVSVTTADPSTPTGPVSGAAAPADAAPAPEAASAPPAPANSGGGAEDVEANAVANPAENSVGGGAGVEQYATDDQYDNAAADQYSAETPDAPKVAEPVPAPAAPPAPDPARLEMPPVELATPGSTVERSVVLLQAAPPEDYEGPAPGSEVQAPEPAAPKPQAKPAPVAQAQPEATPEATPEAAPEAQPKLAAADPVPAAAAGLTVLPDTGGASLVGLASGVLLAGLGLMRLRGSLRGQRS